MRLYSPCDISYDKQIALLSLTARSFLTTLSFTLDSSLLIHFNDNILPLHSSVSALCFNLNLPPFPEALSQNCSYSSASFLPSSPFCKAGHHCCGWSSALWRVPKQEKGDTMNSYLSAEGNGFSPSLSCSHCPAGLQIMYAHPQSCSKTKGQRERQKQKQDEKEMRTGWKKKTNRKRQTSQGLLHSCNSSKVSFLSCI